MEACPFQGFGLHVCPQSGASQSHTHRRHVVDHGRDDTAGPECLPQDPCTCCPFIWESLPLNILQTGTSLFQQRPSPHSPLVNQHLSPCFAPLQSSEQPLLLCWMLMVFFCLLCLPCQSGSDFVLLIAVSPVPKQYLAFKRCPQGVPGRLSWLNG